VPERPKPRRRRKNKQTSGQVVKRSATTTVLPTRTFSEPTMAPPSTSFSSQQTVLLDYPSSQESVKTSTDSGFSQNLEDEEEKSSSDPEVVVEVAAGPSSAPFGAEQRSFSVATSKPDLLCNFCLSRNKNAGIIHGRITHQICCYPCAKKLFKHRKPCPVCRRRIEKITEIIVA
jgi:hypothetical protein